MFFKKLKSLIEEINKISKKEKKKRAFIISNTADKKLEKYLTPLRKSTRCIYGGVVLYDDKFKISAYVRIVLALAICFITIKLNNNLVISSFEVSFYKNQIFLENLKIIFTIFSFVAFIHACNMLDGINLQLTLFYIFLTIYLFLITSDFIYVYVFITIPLFLILFLNLKKKNFSW